MIHHIDKLASWLWKTSSPSSADDSVSSVSLASSQSQRPEPPEHKPVINRAMSTKRIATPLPPLTPALCFNSTFMRDFLRTSRAQLDDTIGTNLNSLLTPSITSPFDPLSTSDPAANRRGKQPISNETCTAFAQETIFPIWHARSRVISYCSIVATSPDPDDPDKTRIQAENIAHSHKIVNERLDPYSGRFFPQEPRTELLGSVLRNENAVENIVRERTWRILKERCNGLDPSQEGWQEAFRQWQTNQSGS